MGGGSRGRNRKLGLVQISFYLTKHGEYVSKCKLKETKRVRSEIIAGLTERLDELLELDYGRIVIEKRNSKFSIELTRSDLLNFEQ